ncbi:MAG: hypothetical protein ISS74_10855 [Planctomycetes bacterium]|nr:hypothetical protein [Planctomycetota bacterium]
MRRRTFLQRLAASAAAAGLAGLAGPLARRARAAEPAEPRAAEAAPAAENLPPVRQVTRGPKFHWFGYYDKRQFDPTGRFCLGMEVDFEGRSPRADDRLTVGMVDLADGDRWNPLGESRAWGWQQGCMLQWIPGSPMRLLWNDREGDRFVCRILDTRSRAKRTIPTPIYCLSPDGRTAVTPDFARIQDMRPGYGYPGVSDPHKDDMAPKDSGIWRVDLETGERRLILALADIAAFGDRHPTMDGAKHYVNHLLFSTDGSRFIFLHRWRPDAGKGRFYTRMFTATPDGTDLVVLDPSGHTSHFIWRDAEHVLAWTRPEGKRDGFYLFKDKTADVQQVGEGVMTVNGHCTYLPGNAWILNDTYPEGKERLQHVYLYHVPTGRRVPLGHFHLPPAYQGEWRCDTHPRASPDGRLVCIDSPHTGQGRQLHLIDIAGIVT